MSYRIETGETAASGIRRIVREQLEGALRESAALAGPKEAKAVHEVRKRVKKIRALLRLVQKEIGSAVYGEENVRLRSVAHSLSDLRDANVQLQVLEKLREEAGLEMGAFAGFIKVLRAQQRKATGQHKGPHAEAVALLESLHDRLEGWPLDGVTLEALCCAFQKSYREARKCLHYLLDHRAPETVHSWRKHTKRVWYQARILQELQPAVVCQIADDAATIASYLGDLHDLAIVRDKLKNWKEAPAGEREVLLGLICAREQAFEQIALDLGCRFYAEKPGAFRRRILRYAEAWPPGEE